MIAALHRGAQEFVQTGEIRSSTETDLGFRIEGCITTRVVDVVAIVTAGEVLAALDDTNAASELRAAEPDFASAAASEDLANVGLDRQTVLLERQIVASLCPPARHRAEAPVYGSRGGRRPADRFGLRKDEARGTDLSQSDRSELLVGLTPRQNASFEATDARAKRLDGIPKADPDVERFSTYGGSGAIRFYLPMDVRLTNDNVAQAVVVTRGTNERARVQSRLEAAFDREFDDIITRATPLEMGPPVGWSLKFRVTGPDVEKVREIAKELADVVAANPSSRTVNLTAGEPQESVLVSVRQTEARAVGPSSQSIAASLASIFSGATVTMVRDGNRLVDAAVRSPDRERSELATGENLQPSGPGGTAVPLRQVAGVVYGVEDPIVWRRQRIVVGGVVEEAANGSPSVSR